MIDVDRAPASAFGLAEDHQPFDTGWHSHRRHQLLYASKGALLLSTGEHEWLLPPERAAWIPAGTRHRVLARAPVALRTVYLAPRLGQGVGGALRVFTLPTLGRELVLHAMQYGPGERTPEVAARTFAVLVDLVTGWASEPAPLALPTAATPELERAIAWTRANLAEGRLAACARAVGLSPRTLNRRFESELGTSWRELRTRARVLAAAEQLARPGARVTQVAHGLGYQSQGAFSRAFRALLGETPLDYRLRAARRP